MYHIFIIHSSVDGHLGCFLFPLLWLEQQWSWMSKCPCGRVCSLPSKLDFEVDQFPASWGTNTGLHCVIQVCILTSKEYVSVVPPALCAGYHVLSFVLLVLGILAGLWWALGVILICISLLTCWTFLQLPSCLCFVLENSFFSSLSHFKISF